ncbi:DNA translocase FtsK 4TM domain-containing protein [Helicobacter saguini]|uniref:DNA translocase FtsK 4TM domain-containing protein n=1 Tax=Helicobacter saguini TaxID=1548018 RepID=UPI001EE8A215|nr:DNA translocase FtsK 4TM domain-containing protein [Helicobacter saguini]
MILFLWIATIFGYVSPERLNAAALGGENLSNRFFKIGSFGSEFANFNVGLFGYLAYIYLPLLLIVVYRFYDDTSYSFRKVRLTFGYILLFISLLIFQALLFKVGFFGTFICDLLEPFIKIYGVFALAFLGVIVSLFLISQKEMLYILQYLGGTNKMFKNSLGTFLKEAGKKLKDIYVDFNMDYLQRANKKMLNLQYSEIVTMPKSKYTFECELVEPPLDSFAKMPKGAENTAFETDLSSNLNADVNIESKVINNETFEPKNSSELESNLQDSNKLENLDKNATLDSTINNALESSLIKLKTNSVKSSSQNSHIDITKISYLNDNFRHISPKNESENEDVLQRFQKANTHIKLSSDDNFAFSETKENVTIKLKDSKNHNVLESFVSPKSLAIKEEWLRQDTPKTNNEHSSNITIKKVSKNETLESNNMENLQKEVNNQINLIKKEESSILTNNLESNDGLKITLKTKDGSKVSEKKDFIAELRENSTEFIKPVVRENFENIEQNNKENSNIYNIESNIESSENRAKIIENKKIKLSNMPLESSYKVMNMDFTRENDKVDSIKETPNNDSILQEKLENIESNSNLQASQENFTQSPSDVANSCPINIVENAAPSEVLIQEITKPQLDSIKPQLDSITPQFEEIEQEIIIMPLNNIDNIESKKVSNFETFKDSNNIEIIEIPNILSEDSNNLDSKQKVIESSFNNNIKLENIESKEDSKDINIWQKIENETNLQDCIKTDSIKTDSINLDSKDSQTMQTTQDSIQIKPTQSTQINQDSTPSQTTQTTHATQDSISTKQTQIIQDSKKTDSTNPQPTQPSFYLPNEIPTMPIFNNLESKNITDSITFKTYPTFPNLDSINKTQTPQPTQVKTQNSTNNIESNKENITDSITLSLKDSINQNTQPQNIESTTQDSTIIKIKDTNHENTPQIRIKPQETTTTINPQESQITIKPQEPLETLNKTTTINTINIKPKEPQKITDSIINEPYILPPITLLQEPKNQSSIDDSEIDSKIENLLAKMRVFKIRGDIVGVFLGPVVTTFEFRPEADVKVNKVLGLQDDLAMSLKARNIRIQAPIPGKDVIGIEIPNNEAQTIYLRDILESSAFKESENALSIVLGKDIMGSPVIENLAKLPHLLVAGTTGSGKSVGVNTLILSLLYRNSPENLQLIMIDPKKVEFAPYEDLPHLITPIINSPTAAIKALHVAVEEMYKRYELLKEQKTKTILTYNEKMIDASQKMPYFVIIIDELAELMATGGKEAEGAITQIAQMGRAAGMHLIIATQRSSTNVVTGTLKANLPARLSYRVGNMVDSKVVIDTSGAERLLGNGDGLFVSPQGISRVHSPWVSEGEIEDIVNFIKQQREPNYDSRFIEEDSVAVDIESSSGGSGGDLIAQAKQVIMRDQKTSISYIQRQLGIGFNKAANIIEQLEKEGFLSAPNSKGKRDILG